MRLLIYRGGRASESAIALRNKLREDGVDVRINKLDSTPRTNRLVLNWGCSSVPYEHCLNRPQAVRAAIDKTLALTALRDAGIRVPEFTTSPEGLETGTRTGIWLARTNTTGSGGDGIVVVRPPDILPVAPLYVKYVPKVREYRLHVVDGRVIAVQQKRKREGIEQTPDQALIRNYDNGWVFATQNVEWRDEEEKEAAYEEAEEAVMALGLDFGAVDLIISKYPRHPYVLEVNTAPGLESPTILQAYSEAIQEEWGDD